MDLGRVGPELESWVGEKAAGYAFESILEALEVAAPVDAAP